MCICGIPVLFWYGIAVQTRFLSIEHKNLQNPTMHDRYESLIQNNLLLSLIWLYL